MPYLFVLFLFILAGCREGTAPRESKGVFTFHLRMKSEPDRLHPMLSRRGNAAQIERKIFLPLLSVDPQSLRLIPALASKMPTRDEVLHGPLKGDIRYHFEIRPDARWSDGSAVRAADYLFTVKAAQNPVLKENQWSSLLESIDSVYIDPGRPKHLDVYVKPGLLSDIVAGNFELYPESHYDPEHVLSGYSLSRLKKLVSSPDTALASFTDRFSSVSLSRTKVMGSGPYTVALWEPKQRLVLRKKKDWWGEKYAAESAFTAQPDEIAYHFIPDETSSVQLLKAGKIDQISDLTPSKFIAFRRGADTNSFHFKTPPAMRYYFIALNNLHPALADVHVRKALALCTDSRSFIDKMLLGLAVPIAGPVHPSKPYADHRLHPIALDIQKARKILLEAGWKDTDGDGIPDKVIDGKRQKLDFEILITGSELGKNLALLLKQDAAKAGIRVRVRPMRLSAILKRINDGKYELAALAARQSPVYDEMKQSWNSSSIAGRGKNYCFYSDAAIDRWTDSLQIVRDTAKLFELYRKIQFKIYDDQPAIFLCNPLERIVISRRFKPFITVLSPGYDETKYHKSNE